MTLEALLKYRELKNHVIQALTTEDSRTLVVVRVNIPGPNKKSIWSEKLFKEAVKAVESTCKINAIALEDVTSALTQFGETPEYVSIFYVAQNADLVKKLCVQEEETHALGRIFDIDVYDAQGRALTREDLKESVRKCYLCDQPAYECARGRKHDLEALELFLISKAKGL